MLHLAHMKMAHIISIISILNELNRNADVIKTIRCIRCYKMQVIFWFSPCDIIQYSSWLVISFYICFVFHSIFGRDFCFIIFGSLWWSINRDEIWMSYARPTEFYNWIFDCIFWIIKILKYENGGIIWKIQL